MIPSDHFVRFYNEVFKFLDEKQGLEPYYAHISSHQEFHCLDVFSRDGIKGMYDYYVKIRKEENCGLEMDLSEDMLAKRMVLCPSLSKALDNDAGACSKYCLHCPGWLLPLAKKAGIKMIYDMMEPDQPHCRSWAFDDPDKAREKYEELIKSIPAEQLRKNFE